MPLWRCFFPIRTHRKRRFTMESHNALDGIRQVWDMVKESESFRSKFSNESIELWFGNIVILSYENDLILMGIDSEFKFNTVRQRFLGDIKEAFCNLLGFDVDVQISFTGTPVKVEKVLEKTVGMPKQEKIGDAELPIYSFEYTFENFIVGSTNKFAHAACISVANAPASNYNPLFIYGNSGLGKTHLLCAVVHRMKQNNPNVRILYTKGEEFTNYMISCLTNKTMEEFRGRFRTCDVLLIDDIQFIAGKMAIQEEFFHTFNELFEAKKQIILTSDRPPRDIKLLEDRLKSRFEWGLIADIEPPDLELRIAIIKKKAEQANVRIPNEVLTYLAENLRSNIRQIEGAIKKLGALSFLQGSEITMEMAKSCISELLGGAEPVSVTVDKIFASVYSKYGVSKEDIVSAKRNKEIAAARHISVYLIREITEMSFPNIAKIFERDHSTIMSSIESVKKQMRGDAVFAKEMNDLKKDLSEL